MQVSIKIENLDGLHKFLSEKRIKMGDALEPIIKKAGNVLLQAAKSNIGKGGNFPRELTGELRSILKMKVKWKGENHCVLCVGTVDATKDQVIKADSVEYGHASPGNERGTKTTPAHPFMRPAFDSSKKRVKELVQSEINKIIGG